MQLEHLKCPLCGAENKLNRITEDGEVLWHCPHCDGKFIERIALREYEKLEATIKSGLGAVIDEALLRERENKYYNLRSMLWDKIKEEYTDSTAIVDICRDILAISQHDFLAEFFEVANSANHRNVAKYIAKIDEKENSLFIDVVLDFIIKSLKEEYITPTAALLDRCSGIFTPQKKQEYLTKFEKEAKKLSDGIYETSLDRHVFLAYSSKDMPQVIEILNLIESNGLTCFAAFRNLQHGRDAVANYEHALEDAINHCSIFLFVSSINSRSFSCDAFSKEIAYIRNSEMQSHPTYRSYEQIPESYKKLRIEYRLDNIPTQIADRNLKTFFSGLTYVEDYNQLLDRLGECMDALHRSPEVDKAREQEEAKRKIEEEAKLKAEEEAKHKAEEEAKRRAEEEAKRKAEEEAKRKAERDGENRKTGNSFIRGGLPLNSGDFIDQTNSSIQKIRLQKRLERISLMHSSNSSKSEIAESYFEEAEFEYHKLKNYQKAIELYREAADLGHIGAQKALGMRHYYGQGVSQNYVEAVKWYTKAAEQGDANAQFDLGYCYEYGQGVSQNYAEAVKWYTKASAQGNSSAQYRMGSCYYYGRGVSQNYKEAFVWYAKASNQGYAVAQYNLGMCYYSGKGTTQDYACALNLFTKAAAQGYSPAQNALGYCYEQGQGVSQNYAEAVKWYTKAAEQGNPFAQNNLGLCYKNGQGVSQNHAEAVKWYTKAAMQGNSSAQYNLGLCYQKGQGVSQNYAEALKWYEAAAKQGVARAQASAEEVRALLEKLNKPAKKRWPWSRQR